MATLTLQYLSGSIQARDVVAALYRPQSPSHRHPLVKMLRPTPDEQVSDPPPNTWNEVLRYWELMNEAQRAELTAARIARFGRPGARPAYAGLAAPGGSAAG